MGDISKHFSRSEYACKCNYYHKLPEDGYCGGDFDAVDKELNEAHERIRERLCFVFGFGVGVKITSGNRCPKHNKDEGGAPRSTHKRGIGSDLFFYNKVTGEAVDLQICYDTIDNLYPGQYGLKLYKSWIHFDVREGYWRG